MMRKVPECSMVKKKSKRVEIFAYYDRVRDSEKRVEQVRREVHIDEIL
jgi:hypothetical protein